MRRVRFTPERGAGSRGFSRWVQPRMESYLLACCDCGLVHEMQFRVRTVRTGNYAMRMRVQFRARRAERFTAAERRRGKA